MEMTATQAVAAEIRAEMARQQRRQADLADLLGLSGSSVSLRLNGHQELTISEMLRIAAWLDCDPAAWIRVAA